MCLINRYPVEVLFQETSYLGNTFGMYFRTTGTYQWFVGNIMDGPEKCKYRSNLFYTFNRMMEDYRHELLKKQYQILEKRYEVLCDMVVASQRHD